MQQDRIPSRADAVEEWFYMTDNQVSLADRKATLLQNARASYDLFDIKLANKKNLNKKISFLLSDIDKFKRNPKDRQKRTDFP